MKDDTTMTDDKRTLKEMSHTNPFTGEAFGSTQTYSRGKTIAADGGAANEADADDSERLEDVSHTPPTDSEGAQAAYDRGNEDE